MRNVCAAILRIWLIAALAGCSAAGGRRPPPSPPSPPVPAPAAAPRLLLHDWFGNSPASTPSFIRANKERLDGLPFDGVAVYMRKPDLSDNVTISVFSDQPLGFQRIADVLAPLRGLEFRSLLWNFAAVIAKSPPDFFDDWTTVVRNLADLARAGREAGLRGIYFDNETYFSPWAKYPDGVKYPSRSLREYQDQAFLRGRQAMEAMVLEHPGITVISLHGPYISEPKAPSPLFPQWQGSNQLLGPLFAGMFAAAGAGTCVDGGELYHLRTQEEFAAAHEWRKRTIASSETDCAFIPRDLRAAWSKVSVGFGVYDRPFKGRPMSPEVLRSTLSNALRRADGYVWLYVEGPTFLRPASQGGAGDDWVDAVRRGRTGP